MSKWYKASEIERLNAPTPRDGVNGLPIFSNSQGDYKVAYENSPTKIPAAAMAVIGSVDVSVFGLDSTGEVRVVTKAAPNTMDVVASGKFVGEVSEDDVSLLGQILQAVSDANTAAETANTAAENAGTTVNQLKESVETFLSQSQTSVNNAVSSAGTATSAANAAAQTAKTAADNADSSADAADAAATKANTSASRAENAYTTLQPILADISVSGNQPRKTLSGNVVSANDAWPAKPLGIRVKGKTRQNLWANPSGTSNGVTATSNDDGSITVSGTATANAFFDVTSYVLRPSAQYTLSIDHVDSWIVESHSSFRIQMYDNIESNSLVTQKWVNTSGDLSTKFTVPANVTAVKFGLRVASGTTVSGTYRIMLNEGSEAEPWCPPGLSSVDELSLVTSGKNLFKPFTNGKVTANDDGSMTVVASTITWAQGEKNPINLPAGTQVTLSTDTVYDTGNRGFGVFFYTSDNSRESIALYNILHRTIQLSEDCVAYQCWFNGVTTSSATSRVMMEIGSEATDYEPPQATTTPINLDGHSLRSLPDGTRDELVIAEDGSARIEKNVYLSTVSVDSSLVMHPQEAHRIIYSDGITPGCIGGYTNQLCDKFVPGLYNSANKTFSSIHGSGTGNTSWYFDTGAMTRDAAKGIIADQLPQTNVYRITKQIIELPSVTLPVLPAPTYNVYANAEASDTGYAMAPDVEIEYVRDINIALADLEAKIADLVTKEAANV